MLSTFSRIDIVTQDELRLVRYPVFSRRLSPSKQTMYRLDSIGKGGFSHDFQSLTGNHSPVMEAFDGFGSLKPSLWAMFVTLMGPIFPKITANLPTEQGKVAKMFSDGVREISGKLLVKDAGDKLTVMDKSILGALSALIVSNPKSKTGIDPCLIVRSETASSVVQMSIEEIHAQVRCGSRYRS